MKITFVLPFASISGGNRVVAKYAAMWLEMGHDVKIVSQPFVPRMHWRTRLKIALGRERKPVGITMPMIGALNERHIVLDRPGPPTPQSVPDADVIVATWWETAEWVAALPPSKGRKVYLLQDYEMFPYLPTDRVAASYDLPLRKIAVSSYIRNEIMEKHGSRTIDLIANGVDLDQFSSPARQKNQHLKLGFLYTKTPRKSVHRAIAALDVAKSHLPHLQAVAFGSKPVDPNLPLPDWITYHCNPPQDSIADIYASCDAWLFPSDKEGFGLPILESMGCRTPVIATPAGAAPDLVDKSNGFLVERDVDAFVDAIMKVDALSKEDWRAMSQAACDTAQNHSWDKAAKRFLTLLETAA